MQLSCQNTIYDISIAFIVSAYPHSTGVWCNAVSVCRQVFFPVFFLTWMQILNFMESTARAEKTPLSTCLSCGILPSVVNYRDILKQQYRKQCEYEIKSNLSICIFIPLLDKAPINIWFNSHYGDWTNWQFFNWFSCITYSVLRNTWIPTKLTDRYKIKHAELLCVNLGPPAISLFSNNRGHRHTGRDGR